MSSQDINQIVLVGRLTRDAELSYTSSGSALCKFAIAVNRRVKKGDNWIDEASFFDITLFGKQAEGLQQYLSKGGQVAIDGQLKQDRWEKDGQKFSKIGIHVENIQLLGGKRADGQPGNQRSEATPERDQDFDPQAYEDTILF